MLGNARNTLHFAVTIAMRTKLDVRQLSRLSFVLPGFADVTDRSFCCETIGSAGSEMKCTEPARLGLSRQWVLAEELMQVEIAQWDRCVFGRLVCERTCKCSLMVLKTGLCRGKLLDYREIFFFSPDLGLSSSSGRRDSFDRNTSAFSPSLDYNRGKWNTSYGALGTVTAAPSPLGLTGSLTPPPSLSATLGKIPDTTATRTNLIFVYFTK